MIVEKRTFTHPHYSTLGGRTILDVRIGYESYGTHRRSRFRGAGAGYGIAGLPTRCARGPSLYRGLKRSVGPRASVSALRSGEAPRALILFVAGEPESTPGVRDSGVGLAPRFDAMFLVGPGILPRTVRQENGLDQSGPDGTLPPPSSDERPWHLPAAQVACLQIVLDAAKRQRREVLVVDVDRPGGYQELVSRWVRPADVLPLLVRSDGARLEGEESFTSARVRRFIAGR